MFGYVGVDEKELKVKEAERYRAFYYGLYCSLKRRYGKIGELVIRPDLVFLILLFTAIYEPDNETGQYRFLRLSMRKQCYITNCYVDYCADMNVLLAYIKCMDDWIDENKIVSYGLSWLLRGKEIAIRQRYTKKVQVIYDNVRAIRQCEREDIEQVPNVDAEICGKKQCHYQIDTAAGYYGNIVAELTVCCEDEWAEWLRRMGYYLGKFLYLMDAYEDMVKDAQTGNYNPALHLYRQYWKGPRNHIQYVEAFEMQMQHILTATMEQCVKAFEHLPVVQESAILKNILFYGVWCRYDEIYHKRKEMRNPNRTYREIK